KAAEMQFQVDGYMQF
ncbi:unnamed protein product, partial [Rotaria magnacalcarata]